MKENYDTSTEAYRAICDRVGSMMNLVAAQMQSHPQIVGMCMVSVMKERYGQEALDDIIKLAKLMRKSIVNDRKARGRRRNGIIED